MELQAFLQIFKTDGKIFWGIIALGALSGFIWAATQSESYSATLTLNVARTSTAAAPDEYNDFYRLQADERFADTVVRWLEAPRIAANIFARVDEDTAHYSIRALQDSFAAKRMSSHVIDVTYSAPTAVRAHYYAEALIAELNAQARSLNALSQEGWFLVVGQDPVVRDGAVAAWKTVLLGAFVATVIALWVVVARVYMAPVHQNKNK